MVYRRLTLKVPPAILVRATFGVRDFPFERVILVLALRFALLWKFESPVQ
jgi:hypothetical protein